jgi:hypothetical protein
MLDYTVYSLPLAKGSFENSRNVRPEVPRGIQDEEMAKLANERWDTSDKLRF